jgi:glycosyltransferase involved in cell wall biosynthesis
MNLSAVITTLNGRERLGGCLDALADHAPDTEVVVVNGPSTDGTMGAVRDRDDVDVLVQVAERNHNVARNAGIEVVSGDAVAFIDDDVRVDDDWRAGVEYALSRGADAVTGPTRRRLDRGLEADSADEERVAGRRVTLLRSGNAVLSTATIQAADGFDERLAAAGLRDLSHRLATLQRRVSWQDDVSVTAIAGTDGGLSYTEKYRALGYWLAKNYGPHPGAASTLVSTAVRDALSAATGLVTGETTPSGWIGTGRDVVANAAAGAYEGFSVRSTDPAANPAGLSSRTDRIVDSIDWR